MKIRHLIKGKVFYPQNARDIYLEINHDQGGIINQPIPHVGIKNLFFTRQDVQQIRGMLDQPPGITEGVPYDIEITERGVVFNIRLYLDLMDEMQISNQGVQVSVKMEKSLDWFADRVNAFTHESMYLETGVTPFVIDGVTYGSYKQFFDQRCIYVPYVISNIPQWNDAFMAIFGITYIGTELYKVSKNILQWSQPLPGFGLVLGVAQLVLEIAFAVLLIATLIGLLTQLIRCLIQPVKYHGAMLVTDLIKVTCAKLGLQMQSSIFDTYPFNQVAYLPEKYNAPQGGNSIFRLMGINVDGFTERGYTAPAPGVQHGYYNGVAGDFFGLVKSICNGKIIIDPLTNILQVERADYFPTAPQYQLKPIRQDWHTYNTSELLANTILSFLIDLNDKNTTEQYQGNKLQATHQQITTNDLMKVSLKGLREINIPAARGINKTSLTFIEKAVKDLQVVWHIIENIAIAIIDIILIQVNILIIAINILIAVWNLVIIILKAITEVINTIIDAVNTLGFSIDKITLFDDGAGQLDYIQPIQLLQFQSLDDNQFDDRINALLLENDIVSAPKLLFVDTNRQEFISERIAYLHPQNLEVINTQKLWNDFYFIDSFVGSVNNRFTKISPALNTFDSKNKCVLSLKDFMQLVSNAQFKDNFGDNVIAESIQWYIHQNGAADFLYRKHGWLKDPQHPNAIERAKEININLKLQITTPDGQ